MTRGDALEESICILSDMESGISDSDDDGGKDDIEG